MNKEKQGENTGESRGWHREGEEREGKRRAGKSRGRPGRARRARRASRAGGQGRGGKNRGRMTGSGGDKSQSSAVIMIGVVRQVGSSDRPPICLLNTCLVEDLVGAGAVRPPRRPAVRSAGLSERPCLAAGQTPRHGLLTPRTCRGRCRSAPDRPIYMSGVASPPCCRTCLPF